MDPTASLTERIDAENENNEEDGDDHEESQTDDNKIVATLFNLQPMRISESPVGEEWLKPELQALAGNLKEMPLH